MKEHAPIEIERKYLIRMPALVALQQMSEYTVSDIEQIYLPSPGGATHRIRRRTFFDTTCYTETIKKRIDARRAYENEHQISEEEYNHLKSNRDMSLHIICKKRHTFVYKNQIFEVDIYPFWTKQCVLETELNSADDVVDFPSCLSVIREVSGNSAYSNASLSKAIPQEDIL